jgi:hypothetical protein
MDLDSSGYGCVFVRGDENDCRHKWRLLLLNWFPDTQHAQRKLTQPFWQRFPIEGTGIECGVQNKKNICKLTYAIQLVFSGDVVVCLS